MIGPILMKFETKLNLEFHKALEMVPHSLRMLLWKQREKIVMSCLA